MKNHNEAKERRRNFTILDYKLGTNDDYTFAMERQAFLDNQKKELEDHRYLERTRLLARLKQGSELNIDTKDKEEIKLVLALRREGLININELNNRKFTATWRHYE